MPSTSVETALSLIKSYESRVLGLVIAGKKVTPGLQIAKAEAKEEPELSFSASSSTGAYIVICLDLDAPFVSFSFLGPILHWIQSGLKAAAGSYSLTSPESWVVDYAPPRPPPGSGPHRYVFLLYEQPADFDVKKYASAGAKKVGIRGRIRYDLESFENEAKLGPVVAANYFNSN